MGLLATFDSPTGREVNVAARKPLENHLFSDQYIVTDRVKIFAIKTEKPG